MKAIVLAALVALVSHSVAADGAALYKKCASCHGVNAEKSALGKSKIITSMSLEENIAALKGYKDGTYGGPMKALMKGQVGNYTDEEIQAVAEYVVGLGK
jgi:cytochrome c553